MVCSRLQVYQQTEANFEQFFLCPRFSISESLINTDIYEFLTEKGQKKVQF